MSNEFDDGWAFVLRHEDERIRRIAERASREPVLRRLFPYASMSNLRFSTVAVYPYDDLPYILTTPTGRYQARDADHRPLAGGALDDVIRVVVQAIESGR